MSDCCLTDKWIERTRKAHRCDWCGEWIEKGARIRYSTGVYEGNFYTSRMHPECHYAWVSVWRESYEGYDPRQQARGRRDDDRKAGPQFSPEGERIAQ